MEKYVVMNEQDLEIVTGGGVCSIMDLTCMGGEAIIWIGKNITRNTRPVKCQYVGVTAYSCG